MKIQWCWKCKKDVPMLDEREWAEALALHLKAVRYHKRAVETEAENDIAEHRRADVALRECLNQLTHEMNEYPYACMNHAHRVAARGDPCPNCGQALRTPAARQCFECGWMSHKAPT